jgi:ubiquinone/menaquinone biosynthesis C-methylase UbiE
MLNWHEEAKKQWDDFAEKWSENARDMWENGSRKSILPFFTETLKEGAKVCDLGCGDGYATVKLAQMGFDAIGVDLSEEMIESAKQKLHDSQSVQFIQADISNLPFSDGEYDAIMAINSIEWTENPLHTLHEIKRIVKPNGVACFGILGPTAGPRQAHSYKRLYGEKVIMNSMQAWEFERLALENGWELLKDQGVEKKEAKLSKLSHLPKELQQAVSFMWLFLLRKKA